MGSDGLNKAGAFDSEMEKFFSAAKSGDVEKIRDILRKIPAAKKWRDKDNGNRTALMYGAENGRLAVVMAMTMLSDADVDAKNARGSTALMFACQKGFGPIAEHLLDSEANPNTKNIEETTALMVAAWSGNTDICTLLVKRGARLDDVDLEKNTALMLAATCGNEKACLALLALGANKALKNDANKTASTLAAEAGFKDLAEKIRLFEQATPAVVAVTAAPKNDNSAEKEAARAKAEILKAAGEGDFAKVIALLEKDNTLVNTANANGSTLLMFASQMGKVDAITDLIRLGADFNATNANKTTALMVAAAEGHVEAVRTLARAGADKALEDDDGFTAADFADKNNFKDLGDAIRRFVYVAPEKPKPVEQEKTLSEMLTGLQESSQTAMRDLEEKKPPVVAPPKRLDSLNERLKRGGLTD